MIQRQGCNPDFNLHALAEEIYFWLMRSTSDPKAYASTFQLLSQIMRITRLSDEGGHYIPENIEAAAFSALYNIKEQMLDGKIQINKLFETIQQILRKLVHENPKAQLVVHATEIEYIFCIRPTYDSSTEAEYRQKFKKYLKTLVDSVNGSLSSTQMKAIVQILSQVVKNPDHFSRDPQKILSDSLQRSGIIVIDRPQEPESESA